MTSECRKMLCGITTALSTDMTTTSAPEGTEGTTQPAAALPHSVSTSRIS
jgi:hypothetical protein